MTGEPVLHGLIDGTVPVLDAEISIVESIRKLVTKEPFAVLCTQSDGQPYGSLVAYAFCEDLASFTFATPKATRKYRLLSKCSQVALLVDDRAHHRNEMMKVSALTVTGRACQLEQGEDHARWAAILLGRHPHLRSFVCAPSTALFRVDTIRFLHVSRFQEVRQWTPMSNG